MAIPQSEREIVEVMDLDKLAKNHPIPPINYQDWVVKLDGREFSSEAINAALNMLEIAIIRELAQYPKEVTTHNNISAMGGSYGTEELWRYLHSASKSSEVQKALWESKPQ